MRRIMGATPRSLQVWTTGPQLWIRLPFTSGHTFAGKFGGKDWSVVALGEARVEDGDAKDRLRTDGVGY